MSGENISSDTSDGVVKISARLMFAKWLKANEDIFPEVPNVEFYKLFFRKAEYYLVHEWPFNFKIWMKMYQLSTICYESYSPLPILKLVMMKLTMKRT